MSWDPDVGHLDLCLHGLTSYILPWSCFMLGHGMIDINEKDIRLKPSDDSAWKYRGQS